MSVESEPPAQAAAQRSRARGVTLLVALGTAATAAATCCWRFRWDDGRWAAGPAAAEGAPQRRSVSFVSINDVYKLVGMQSDLPYFFLEADADSVRRTAGRHCNGAKCGRGTNQECGRGADWEACFPAKFPAAQRRSIKAGSHEDGPRVVAGPCGSGDFSDGERYGHMLDFAATFRLLKDDIERGGGLAVGTLAGDFIAPSYLAMLHKGKQLVEIMNHMGVDLVNIGNHDVDFGSARLMEQMNRSAFHYLNANLRHPGGEDFQQALLGGGTVGGNDGTYGASDWRQLHRQANSSYGPGYAVLDKGDGVRVCVLGTTDVDKMEWGPKGVDGAERDIPAAIAILQRWEADNVACTLKVAMTHTRTGNDLNLFHTAEALGLHLDAIIGGHDHYAAFAELRRGDGGTTFMVKAGADARLISKLTFSFSSGRPAGTLELVPVVTGSCSGMRKDARLASWYAHAQELFGKYAQEAQDADQAPLNIRYYGMYDTNAVRDAESRAVNMWSDLMRESVSGDVLFFQAGLVRQDFAQDFGRRGLMLSELFLLEEFPWGDDDGDRRTSLFAFEVPVEVLVTKTLPWLARKYWCDAPFNDANRIHMSGFIVEMRHGPGCGAPGSSPLQSVTFVGGCHQGGGLQAPANGSCCSSPACGRLWTGGGWDARATPAVRAQPLTVVTAQFCVPSKYVEFGEGFHDVGMSCPEAEPGARRRAYGVPSALTLLPEAAFHAPPPPDVKSRGYPLKPALLAMLKKQAGDPLVVGSEAAADCAAAGHYYEAHTFVPDCLCELGVSDGPCSSPPRSNGFPRFYKSRAAFSVTEF